MRKDSDEASGPLTDVFDPTHSQGVWRSLPDAVPLPPWRHQREADAILTRSPNLVGRVEELPGHDDFRVFDLRGLYARRHA